MHRFAAICEFKLELQPGNAHLGKNWQCCAACDLNIWRITSKITRALLLCHFKICALFCSVAICGFKLELQYSNAQFGSQLSMFWPVWPWNLTDALKNKGNLFYAIASFVHHFVATCEFRLELPSRNIRIGSKFVFTSDFDLWPLTLTFCFDIMLVLEITPETFMMTRWQGHCEKGVTDRQTDRQIDRQTGGLS